MRTRCTFKNRVLKCHLSTAPRGLGNQPAPKNTLCALWRKIKAQVKIVGRNISTFQTAHTCCAHGPPRPEANNPETTFNTSQQTGAGQRGSSLGGQLPGGALRSPPCKPLTQQPPAPAGTERPALLAALEAHFPHLSRWPTWQLCCSLQLPVTHLRRCWE